MTEHELFDVDELVTQVAARLPFPVELIADMGGTFVLQIDLGTRGGTDDPPDTAGIDGPDSVWWLDVEGGSRTVVSVLGFGTGAEVVAEWIATTARTEGCPAAQNPHASRSFDG